VATSLDRQMCLSAASIVADSGRRVDVGCLGDNVIVSSIDVINTVSDEVCLSVAALLDMRSLCQLEVSCKRMHDMQCSPTGPWCELGKQAFDGLEVDFENGNGHELFTSDLSHSHHAQGLQRVATTASQPCLSGPKRRAAAFQERAMSMRIELCRASWQCCLRMDLLDASQSGIYVEIETLKGLDRLRFGLQGHVEKSNSMMFVPECGLVQEVWEWEDRERDDSYNSPKFCQVMPEAPPDCFFSGKLGIYVQGGRVAFFRRWHHDPVLDKAVADADDGIQEEEFRPWESSGFLTGLSWARGRRLSICVDSPFPRLGHHVVVTQVSRYPPICC